MSEAKKEKGLNELVYVVCEKKPVATRWDGVDYDIGKKPVRVLRGIAEHWKQIHDIRIEEIPLEEVEQKPVVNPLEENNRGTAFSALKEKEGAE